MRLLLLLVSLLGFVAILLLSVSIALVKLTGYAEEDTLVYYSQQRTAFMINNLFIVDVNHRFEVEYRNQCSNYSGFVWSLDGQQLAFNGNCPGDERFQNSIYVMNPTGTKQVRIVAAQVLFGNMLWSGDQQRIFYVENSGHNLYLKSVDILTGVATTYLTQDIREDKVIQLVGLSEKNQPVVLKSDSPEGIYLLIDPISGEHAQIDTAFYEMQVTNTIHSQHKNKPYQSGQNIPVSIVRWRPSTS